MVLIYSNLDDISKTNLRTFCLQKHVSSATYVFDVYVALVKVLAVVVSNFRANVACFLYLGQYCIKIVATMIVKWCV